MSILPKFLYLFRQTPIPILITLFNKLYSIISSFIWNGSTPREEKNTLQLPASFGSFALFFIKYYWATVLVTVHCWLSEEPDNLAATSEAALLGSYADLRNLINRGPRSNPRITALMCTILKVWGVIRAKVDKSGTWSPHTPLWGDPRLPHFQSMSDPVVWNKNLGRCGV